MAELVGAVASADEPAPLGRPILEIDARPFSRRRWFAEQLRHREVLALLARNDFHVRYKRASFGVLWAVAVPAVQAAALAFVFSRFVRTSGGYSYSAYAVAGVLGWGYVSLAIGTASTAIVDGATLTDKVWFPRSLLVLVPCLSNLPGLFISFLLFLPLIPVFGASVGVHTLMLLPAILLDVAFCTALALVLSALHVYFRDVKYLVQAALLVLFYLTPIAYPQRSLGGNVSKLMDFNPFTGITNLFHWAAVGHPDRWAPDVVRSVVISLVAMLILAIVAVEVHRRRDRLFVDLL